MIADLTQSAIALYITNKDVNTHTALCAILTRAVILKKKPNMQPNLSRLKKRIKYIVLSDIHLGHRKTTTSEIVANLAEFFDNYKSRSDLDIIFIAGDLFDRLLDFTTDDMTEAMLWMSRFMGFCARNNIKLRVLEGTPSHDWKQSSLFNTVLKVRDIPMDFKYVDSLSIEHMEDLGLSVLYMPDEWDVSTDKIYDDVLELMLKDQIQQVDIGIFHGMFAYQAPPMATKISKHDESRYLSIVRYFINIGHVHTFSVFDRIIAQGSFDRLGHGQEEPKGGVEVVIDPYGENSFTFLENRFAKLYKTLVLKNGTIEFAIKQIEQFIKGFCPGSHVRLKGPKDHPAMVAYDELRKRFPDIQMSKLTLEEEKEIEHHQQFDDVAAGSSVYQAIAITPDNLKSLLTSEIKPKYTFSDAQWAFYEQTLNSITKQ